MRGLGWNPAWGAGNPPISFSPAPVGRKRSCYSPEFLVLSQRSIDKKEEENMPAVRVNNIEMLTFPGGHLFFITRQKQFIKAITDFLDSPELHLDRNKTV